MKRNIILFNGLALKLLKNEVSLSFLNKNVCKRKNFLRWSLQPSRGLLTSSDIAPVSFFGHPGRFLYLVGVALALSVEQSAFGQENASFISRFDMLTIYSLHLFQNRKFSIRHLSIYQLSNTLLFNLDFFLFSTFFKKFWCTPYDDSQVPRINNNTSTFK